MTGNARHLAPVEGIDGGPVFEDVAAEGRVSVVIDEIHRMAGTEAPRGPGLEPADRQPGGVLKKGSAVALASLDQGIPDRGAVEGGGDGNDAPGSEPEFRGDGSLGTQVAVEADGTVRLIDQFRRGRGLEGACHRAIDGGGAAQGEARSQAAASARHGLDAALVDPIAEIAIGHLESDPVVAGGAGDSEALGRLEVEADEGPNFGHGFPLVGHGGVG